MIKHKLKVLDIIDEAKETKTYILERPKDFAWEEGAHTHIGLVGFDEGEKPNKNWVRHMSISTLPNEEKIGITTRVRPNSSEFKNKLAELSIGEELVLFKLGSRMQVRRSDRPIILLSIGVGIATLRPVILAFLNDSSNVPILLNVNLDSSGEFIFRDELDMLKNDCYKNYWIESRVDFYETIENLAETENAIYYLVGSDIFIKDMIQRLRTKDVDDNDIVIDKRDGNLTQYFGS